MEGFNHCSSEKETLDLGDHNVNENDETIDLCKPEIGMAFDTDEEILDFYRKYAREVGFPVHKRARKKNDDGELRCVSFGCAKGAKIKDQSVSISKPRATMGTECGAYITARVRHYDKKWILSVVNLEHNHKCCPEDARFFKCFREVNGPLQREIDLNDRAGLSSAKTFSRAVLGRGSYEDMPCIEKDIRNAMAKVRRLRLGEGDASAVLAYFTKMTMENSGFYFKFDFDDEDHLRNIFWADGMSREAYKEFGDVVSFDATYLVNKYDMPFAPFIGVNHHGQTILLGCGLISSEDTGTFEWLFSAWLECMLGKDPKAIITDQAKAMQNAIEIVFPQTRHRWCIWHVMKKLPKKFGNHSKYLDITRDMKIVVYESQSPDEFEQMWYWMLDEYELETNRWLNDLFKERHLWVPCYLKDVFWAGMSSTQRSEGVNAFFDGYLGPRTSLKQFVEQYGIALRKKVENEKFADALSNLRTIGLKTTYPMEKQMQKRYTNSKFAEFQLELQSMLYCNFAKIETTSTHTIYYIKEDVCIDNFHKTMTFHVTYDGEQCDVHCTCQNFSFRGIQCRHALSVLCYNNVRKIPDKYILRCWRKDVVRAHTKVKVGFSCWTNDVNSKRYNDLCTKFSELADWVVDDETLYLDIDNWLDCKKKEVQQSLKKAKENGKLKEKQSVENVGETVDENDGSTKLARDPLCKPRKMGRPRKIANQQPKKRTKKKDGWDDDDDDDYTHEPQVYCAPQTQPNTLLVEQQQPQYQYGLAYPENQQPQYQYGLVYPENQYGFANNGAQYPSFPGGYVGGSFSTWMLDGRPYG